MAPHEKRSSTLMSRDPALNGKSTKDSLAAAASESLKILLEEGPRVPATGAGIGGSQGTQLELPPWFDWDKFQRGQRYFQHNIFTMFVAKLSGLLVLLAIPSIVRVLVLTKQSGSPSTAFRRYLSTLSHMMSWYEGDLLEPTSKAYQSLSAVRAKHDAAARKALKTSGSSIPLSQLDMVLTQFAFVGFILLYPRKLGILPTSSSSREADEEGFVHFWRTIAYLLGIQDRFNLCRPSVQETKAVCKGLLVNAFIPAIHTPPPAFSRMARALINGMWAFMPFLDAHAFLRYARYLMGDKVKEDDKKSLKGYCEDGVEIRGPGGPYSKFLFTLQVFVQETLLGTALIAYVLRPYLNMQMALAIFLSHRFPFLTFTHSKVY